MSETRIFFRCGFRHRNCARSHAGAQERVTGGIRFEGTKERCEQPKRTAGL